MSIYGDDEPEDAYDASDPPAIRLLNIMSRLALLDGKSELDVRDLLRLHEALEDLETLHADVIALGGGT